MLSHAKEHESFTGKLLLSTALVAVTVGYGWWQQGQARQQQAAMMAAMQMQAQPVPQAQPQAMMAAPQAATPDGSAGGSAANAPDAAAQNEIAPAPGNSADAAPKSTNLAMAAPQTAAPTQNAAGPTQNVMLPATPPAPPPPMPLTGMDAIRAFLPTEGVSPPLPPVSGTPDANASPPIPAGTHLEDGDYTSDRIQFEWGDLRARIVVAGGKINTVQIVSYPDHRSQSLYLIQLADPILTSEVIKSQQAKVNTVSSATNSSIAFQDAIANAIVKAIR